MKIYLNETININKNINDVFDIIYNKNNTFINNTDISMVSSEIFEWKYKNGLKQKKEFITFCFKKLPEFFSSRLNNNENHIKIKMITKIIKQTTDIYNVETRYKIVNFSPFINTIINKMYFIKTKCVITIIKKNENNTDIFLTNKVSIATPYLPELETFVNYITKSLFENMKIELNKTI